MAKTIMIVDDDPTQRRLMQAVCERAGYFVMHADDGQKAVDILRSPEGQAVSLMMLDLMMPGLDGMDTLEQVRKIRDNLPVIILTARGGIDTVVKAMQKGAVDFFVKPVSPERVIVSINNALNMKTLKSEVSRLQRKQVNALSFDDLIGNGGTMRRVFSMAERAAKSSIPILITGESGTGKEMIARAIQGTSERSGAPFITVNCGALPENLVESILFGHEKGSFTGAHAKHIGKFQEADGGTIFLDEIGELPLDAQVKLLRVLQESEVDPIGSKAPVKVNVRIVSATNRDLADEVSRGTFREDLYYRLNVFPMEVPPLRERKEDIPELVTHFINRYNAEEGRDVSGVQHEVMDVLIEQPWPGNVRQLENAIFRAVVLCEGSYLTAADFPFLAHEFEAADIHAGPPVHVDEMTSSLARFERGREDIPAAGEGAIVSLEEGDLSIFDREGHLRSLYDIEKDLITLALDTYNGQMSEVARRLGIGRSTLYRKVREQGLDVKRTG
ncbi:sigma-54-dependent transcriptional regulator [Aquisalinus flavus]|uniref:DNA-binding transcriptional regulator NtrC n=1 Tax=Aquisalinus flavus TaxID=1526572 RepID=A0A8J2V0Z5_9PROT|nr:sigma-54 dependent transcriptional regulator [Aquisalinus flavus]MBD0426961.1 sigma-54-dependent Fis family transcriptional regulator [Aquisalinus flavus]UNE46798.1 sigma-54-dependent Fis family transcriptional regulator [Aquisalinus flavus]GGC97273.1 sigma-54-dependent Fis family transcriptional regulator [Aquisalinus flavus]